MTLVIADTKAQADYWIKALPITDAARFLSRAENTLGLVRTVNIVAVGPCKEGATGDLVHDLRSRGYSVKFLRETL